MELWGSKKKNAPQGALKSKDVPVDCVNAKAVSASPLNGTRAEEGSTTELKPLGFLKHISKFFELFLDGYRGWTIVPRNSWRVDTRDEAALRSSYVEVQTAVHCLFSKFKRVERAATAGEKGESLTLTTPERVASYRKYQKALDGKVGATHADSACQ